MSHELRTPLNSVLGFAQLLEVESEAPLSEQQKKYVRHILNGGEHLLGLINEILDLAKIEAGKLSLSLEAVNTRAVINECLAFAKNLALKQNITIADDTPEVMPALWTDYLRSKQTILNLLSNAVKYNHADGSVHIQVEERQNGALRINVANTGEGIPPEKQAQLFQPFNRLGAEMTEVEGTGIGLVLSKKLIEAMGGAIGYKNTDKEGNLFWIEFPIATNETIHLPPVKKKKIPSEINAETENRLILYVEDNPSNLMLMEGIFTRFPTLNMISTTTAEQGIALAEERNPAVIILDINLPGMDGFEALRHLKKGATTRDIPVLALSANAMPKDIERGRDAGFEEYLTKPIKIPRLLSAIQKVLETEN